VSKKAHFIGIAGKGMSAVALLLREAGWEISGSDEGFYPPVSDYLAQANISFANGYKAENVPAEADLIVIGKNAKLVPETNAEVRAAFESGKKVASFPEVLHDLTAKSDNIVVAGSYGKSTCTALLSWCLRSAGKDPSYFIGEITKGLPAHAHLGQGGVFVLEGDEYPSANWDSRSKFLQYNARSVLLTSATHDHVNVYPTHEEYLEPFKQLLDSLPEDGLLVVNAGEEHAFALSKLAQAKTVTYGMHADATWRAEGIRYALQSSFELMRGTEKVVTLSTSLLGAHNIENIVAVSALLLEKGLLTQEELAQGIASFEGVKRRMEHLAQNSSIAVVEGFGSSYEKARSAIAAMQLHFPERRLIVVFEPHTFTLRNKAALHQYDTMFEAVQKAYIFEPAQQGAATHAQLTQEEIVERVRASGVDTEPINDPAAALETIQNILKPDDVVLLLTSGELGGLITKIPALVEQKFPQ
jgi:UDP-N-acetylmuramate: L-alanyl-gamma-D-glutamyl-meso-diaminopimelate ligase